MIPSFKSLALLALSTLSETATASPLYARASSKSNDTIVFTNSNGLQFSHMNGSLPNITIFATGTYRTI